MSGFIVTMQLVLGLVGVDDDFTRGHAGWNSSAYLNAARNSLRWKTLLPHRYHTDPVRPSDEAAYTHAPLALHLTNVAAVAVMGDRPASVRIVAALQGVFAVVALLFVVGRLWSVDHGLLAAALFVCLPINAIYVNMSNHSSGFIAWALLMLYAYLRFRQTGRRRSFAALLGTSFLATSWDWPAYYVAFLIAVHWLAGAIAARLHPSTESTPPRRLLLPLAVYCFWILATAGLLALVFVSETGSLEDLWQTFELRQAVDWESFAGTLSTVPRLMFGSHVLLALAVWLLAFVVRLFRGRAAARELIPIAFGVAGIAHLVIFRFSAVVHEYWLWPILPCVAIAMAELVIGLVRLRPSGVRPAASESLGWRTRLWGHWAVHTVAIAFALVVPEAIAARLLTIVPSGRNVGGSMWFVSGVRAARPAPFDSARDELRFARKVRRWTDRSTGVMLHPGFLHSRPEPWLDITLDRAVRNVGGSPIRPLPLSRGVSGWVLIGARADISLPELFRTAGDRRVVLYDHFFMVDFRRRGTVQVYAVGLGERTFVWSLIHTPFERPRFEVRDHEFERALQRRRDRVQVEGS